MQPVSFHGLFHTTSTAYNTTSNSQKGQSLLQTSTIFHISSLPFTLHHFPKEIIPIPNTMSSAVTRIATRRSFSILSAARGAARSIESHPFQRLSITQKSAKADWAAEGRRVGKQVAIFVPGIALLLGWPYLAKAVADGHV